MPTFYRHPKGRSLPARGTLSSELARAVQSPDSVARLRSFLKKHEPPDGEFQDGFHYNRIRAAQYELMRLEYLNGNVKAGDRLLARLQDVDR